VLHARIDNAEESRRAAVDCDEQHLFAALSQPFWPVTEVVDGKPEVAEQRGVAKNDGVPGNGTDAPIAVVRCTGSRGPI
jgi:hypothetical protein